MQIAQDLRRQQQTRIQAKQNPDGIPYAPRKQRKNIRGKQGRIKKQKASMFNKLRTNKAMGFDTLLDDLASI